MTCDNCGDGSGWAAWYPREIIYENGIAVGLKEPSLVWVGCADCNDDGLKPKPDICECCGETKPFCECSEEVMT